MNLALLDDFLFVLKTGIWVFPVGAAVIWFLYEMIPADKEFLVGETEAADFTPMRRCAAVAMLLTVFMLVFYDYETVERVARYLGGYRYYHFRLLILPLVGGAVVYFCLYGIGRVCYPKWKAAQGGFIVLILLLAMFGA